MRHIVLAGMLLAASMVPISASAQAEYDDCAVVSRDGEAVVVHGSFMVSGVQASGSTCTRDIQSGNWLGADKYRDWGASYQHYCSALFPDDSASYVRLYVKYARDYNFALEQCQAYENEGATVTYY